MENDETLVPLLKEFSDSNEFTDFEYNSKEGRVSFQKKKTSFVIKLFKPAFPNSRELEARVKNRNFFMSESKEIEHINAFITYFETLAKGRFAKYRKQESLANEILTSGF